MSEGLRIRLDRTICDGFGICAKHAPEYFSLDDWGYASLIGDGTVPEQDRDAVMRALMDCPVHAIIHMGEHRPAAPPVHIADEVPAPHLKADDSEAISEFVR
jgi:ferredoxin